MCGIFAYRGADNATQKVFEGLQKLEYRGYDSWGIAAKGNPGVSLEKHVGKIGSAKPTLPQSNVALGHTRWATHGGVTKKNAHPHTDCTGSVVVVHNGIIDNYADLKKSLESDGHTFRSETDTEVFTHLIERYKAKYSFLEAVRRAFLKLQGYSTLVALDAESGEIVAFKNGSPLVGGVDRHGGYYMSSDIPSLLAYTGNMVVLEDGEGLVIDGKGMRKLRAQSGVQTKAATKKVHMAEEKIEKGRFDHFLQKEVYDQPEAILRTLSHNKANIRKAARMIESAKNIYAVACGTASYATLEGTYMLAAIAKRQMTPITANEFATFAALVDSDTLLIAASQSGETIDTIQALRQAKARGARTISMVNVPSSTLSREADLTIPLWAGVERAVISSKAFMTKMAVFFLIASELAHNYRQGEKEMQKVARVMQKMLQGSLEGDTRALAKKLKSHDHAFLIGRGRNYPVTLEGALKIKEASYIHAEGFAGGELKHGVIALIEKGTPCIALVANDEEKTDILSGAMELKARGARIIGIAPDESDVFDDWIEVPDGGELSCFYNTVPLQLLGYHLALERGADPDKPRNLAKSVTVK